MNPDDLIIYRMLGPDGDLGVSRAARVIYSAPTLLRLREVGTGRTRTVRDSRVLESVEVRGPAPKK